MTSNGKLSDEESRRLIAEREFPRHPDGPTYSETIYQVKGEQRLQASFVEFGGRVAALGDIVAQNAVFSLDDLERWSFEIDRLQVGLIQLRRRVLEHLRFSNPTMASGEPLAPLPPAPPAAAPPNPAAAPPVQPSLFDSVADQEF